ncbi:MAG TPA: class I SAM-dependent methyltransferase [Oligoflexia bacterium]|nr:class I SAM-dependent methyltransferase [Oligoflexia bacterium]HMP48975.1 class I SAM-dependent methyltransferase [Oligoflexia bacterium]
MSYNRKKSIITDAEWFRPWFEHKAYLELYSHREESEAKIFVETIRQLLNHAPLSKNKREILLDCCCGAGRHLNQLSKLSNTAIGMDLSFMLLKTAKNLYPNLDIVRGDLRALPFKYNSLDIITSLFTSFGYFESEKENINVINSWSKLLRDQGLLLLDLPNATFLHSNLVPCSEKETENFIFNEKRVFTKNKTRVVKEITVNHKYGRNKPEIFSESVRLYTHNEIVNLFKLSELSPALFIGDYSGKIYNPDNSQRIIIFAVKGTK